MNINVLKNDEKAIFSLRELYQKYGYSQFKMSKFEEYDLYVRNKNFLVSDNIITFTDTDGKLMALKPDVTLSIIKNSKDGTKGVQKLYYNENVYRISKGTQSFKEIMQVGLECIGDVDDYCIFEVLMLAAESLNSISSDCVLDVSHLGIVSDVLEELKLTSEGQKAVVQCIGEKNLHGIDAICKEEGVDGTALKKLVSTYGTPDKVFCVLDEFKSEKAEQLKKIVTLVEQNGFKGRVRIDFSVVNDMNYYNGFVFKGYVNGIATGILSGGQYDNLMSKMRKKSKAIGFAVYLDMLERLNLDEKEYDVDTVLLYDENADLVSLKNAVEMLTQNGKTVTVQKEAPEKIKYRQLLKLNGKGVEIIETNA
ncbi:MAG: ATP phosphoribosyltransferase regulatory subunit [Clostridia bacterium]|nr:ATP phosphoribosyltransferase regulatory subunit [Clostridia bacterium]